MLATKAIARATFVNTGKRHFCLTNAKDYKAAKEKDAKANNPTGTFTDTLKKAAEKVKETVEDAGQTIAKAGYVTSDELAEKVKRVGKNQPPPKTEGEAIARETVR